MPGQKSRKQHRKNNEITSRIQSIILNKIKDSTYERIALWCSGNMRAFGACVSGSTPLRAVYYGKIFLDIPVPSDLNYTYKIYDKSL